MLRNTVTNADRHPSTTRNYPLSKKVIKLIADAWLLLGRHDYVCNRDCVALHLTGEPHSVTSVGFEQHQALIGDVIHLAVSDKHVFATAFDARQRAVALAHSRVSGNHFCVTGAAHAVANLTGPSLISG